jgi:hypothetical protein
MIDQKQLENVESFKYLGSILTNDGRCTCEIKCRLAMAKAAFNKKRALFTSTLDLELRKKLANCCVWSIVLEHTYLPTYLPIHTSNSKNPYQRHGHQKQQNAVNTTNYMQVRIWSWSESMERKTGEQCLGLDRNLCEGFYLSASYGPTIQRLRVWACIDNVTN